MLTNATTPCSYSQVFMGCMRLMEYWNAYEKGRQRVEHVLENHHPINWKVTLVLNLYGTWSGKISIWRTKNLFFWPFKKKKNLVSMRNSSLCLHQVCNILAQSFNIEINYCSIGTKTTSKECTHEECT